MYYRNNTEINGIEPHCLWQLKKGFFVLADTDQFISAPITEKDKFYPAKHFPLKGETQRG